MNIYVRELKANFRSLLIWSAIVASFVLVGTSKFSAYANNPEMLKILDEMPAAMLAAFQMEAFNLTTISGFLGLMFTYFALLLGIAAAMWGSDIISKEERDKTVEFALTLPVTRARVVTAKALAALSNCVVLLLVAGAAILAGSMAYGPDADYYRFLALCLAALFFLQVLFLAVGLMLGCALKQYRRAGSLAIWVLLGAYILSVLVSLDKRLDFLKYLTPFRYFDPVKLLNQSRLEVGYVALALAIAAVCTVAAYFTYSRRDLYI